MTTYLHSTLYRGLIRSEAATAGARACAVPSRVKGLDMFDRNHSGELKAVSSVWLRFYGEEETMTWVFEDAVSLDDAVEFVRNMGKGLVIREDRYTCAYSPDKFWCDFESTPSLLVVTQQ